MTFAVTGRRDKPLHYRCLFGGDGWIRTTVLLRTDLQSAAIDLSATSPFNTLLRMCVLKHTNNAGYALPDYGFGRPYNML